MLNVLDEPRTDSPEFGAWCRFYNFGYRFVRCQRCDHASFVFGSLNDYRELCGRHRNG